MRVWVQGLAVPPEHISVVTWACTRMHTHTHTYSMCGHVPFLGGCLRPKIRINKDTSKRLGSDKKACINASTQTSKYKQRAPSSQQAKQVSKQSSKQSSKQASKRASKRASKQTKQTNKQQRHHKNKGTTSQTNRQNSKQRKQQT